MPPPHSHHPKVFISYSHDSPEHSDRVRELSNRLRLNGIDCNLDQYETSPPEGWPLWMEKQIRDAEFVLMVCTETYHRRIMKEEEAGKGLGVTWEGHITYQDLYNDGAVNKKFIPTFFNSIEVKHIPKPLQGTTYYLVDSEAGYEALYRQLTKQPLHRKPELGEVRDLKDVQKLQPLEPKERKHDFFATNWLTNLPFERNPFFTGREEILARLQDAFSKKAATAQTQAIFGLGGLGKSQIAIEYAYRHRDDYNTVLWVRSDSQAALSLGFGEIARLLDLPEKDAQNPDDIVRAVNRWLENNSGWLLIFDNADEPALVKPFRPNNANGHFLLTSRAQVFDALGIVKPIEINVMSPEEAVTFLFTRTGRDDDNAKEREASAEISEALGYLPLALEQAGAYINAKKAQFQQYLASYRNRRLELLQEARPVTGDYPESVATTWSINFHEVEETSEASSHLLRVSAFLSPDRIPLELISKGKAELGPALSEALAEVDDDPLALNEVLEPLTRYSFIRLDADSQTYNIHRLVQEVVQDGMDPDTQRLWAERVVRALAEAFPNVEFSTWRLCERLLSHARVAANLIDEWDLELEPVGVLLNQVAFYSQDRGQFSEAEQFFKQSLAIFESVLEPEHTRVSVILSNLAVAYRVQGKYKEAEPLLKRSLAIAEAAYGAEHLEVATTVENLAVLYTSQGRFSEAEALYQRSLLIREKSPGADQADLARSLNNLGELYRLQQRYAEAKPLYQRSIAIREKALDPEHPELATSYNNLGLLYFEEGDFDQAEPLIQQSLAILDRTQGPNHPYVAFTLNNLARLYAAQGKYREAERLFRRSLGIRESNFGPHHPNVALLLENLAILLQATQRSAEAEQLLKRAANIRANSAQ